MARRDIIIGVLILAVLAIAIFFWNRNKESEQLQVTEPETLSVEDRIEDRFNLEIPEGAEKTELKDVTGGDASAIVSEVEEAQMTTFTVLADLPDPEAGTFYQGWLVRGIQGDENYSQISIGKLTIAKGGYLLEYQSGDEYKDHDRYIVSKEKVLDSTIEEVVLEGDR